MKKEKTERKNWKNPEKSRNWIEIFGKKQKQNINIEKI